MTHEITFDDELTDSIVVTISRAVSHVTDTPIEELPPLQETIDCDALETLFDSFSVERTPGVGQVRFPFHGCTVHVETTGTVRVTAGTDSVNADGAR